MNRQAEELKKLIDEILELLKLHWKTPNEDVWTKKVLRFLKKEFGETSEYYKQFHDSVYSIGGIAISENTPDSYFQNNRSERIQEYKLLLESFFDELKDVPEQNTQHTQQSTNQNQSNDKLLELQQKIEEAKMEAERRKAVVEAKVYGAEIEIITELRNELKRKDETRKKILELESKINQIDDKSSKDNKRQTEFEEDRLYEEISQKFSNEDKKNLSSLFISARQILTEIKGLREGINTLQKQYGLSASTIERTNLSMRIQEKTIQMTPLLKSLADIWGEFIR